MLDLIHHLDNEHAIALTSYMYGELDHGSRSEFEQHLAECDSCAIELASFAEARLGVIEWRRADFDWLTGPVITIPQDVVATANSQVGLNDGLIAGLWSSLRSFPLYARLGISMATAALFVGFIYFGSAWQPSDRDVAGSMPVPVVQPSTEVNVSVKTPTGSEFGDSVAKLNSGSADNRLRHEQRMSRVYHSPNATKTSTAVAPVRRTPSRIETAVKKAPRLNGTVEEEDKTLRLSDLFADLGSTEE